MNALSQHLAGIPRLQLNPVSKALQEFSEGSENPIFSEELASLLAVAPESTTFGSGAERGANGQVSTTIGPLANEPAGAAVIPGSPLISPQSGNSSPLAETIDGKSLPLNLQSDARPAPLALVSSPETIKLAPNVDATPAPAGNLAHALIANRTPPNTNNVLNAVPPGPLSLSEAASAKEVPLSLDRGSGEFVPSPTASRQSLEQGRMTQGFNYSGTAIPAEDAPVRGNDQAHKVPPVDARSRFGDTATPAQRSVEKLASEIVAARNPVAVESSVSSRLQTNTSTPVEFIRATQASVADQSNLPAGVTKAAATVPTPVQMLTPEQPVAAAAGHATAILTSAKSLERPFATGKAEVPSLGGQLNGELLESADLPLATSVNKILVSAKSEPPAFNQLIAAKTLQTDPSVTSAESHTALTTAEDSGSVAAQHGSSIVNSTVNPRNPLPGNFASLQFGDPQFQRNFNDQVLLMAGQGVQKAHLSLNPQELGPVEIRLAMQNDEVSIQVASTNAVVREALEQALPRLREMFEQTGLKLVDQQVAGQFSEQSGNRSFAEQSPRQHQISAELGESLAAVESRPGSAPRGLVDTYI